MSRDRNQVLTANNSIPQAKAAIEKAIAEGNTHLVGRYQALLNADETLEEQPLDLDQF